MNRAVLRALVMALLAMPGNRDRVKFGTRQLEVLRENADAILRAATAGEVSHAEKRLH